MAQEPNISERYPEDEAITVINISKFAHLSYKRARISLSIDEIINAENSLASAILEINQLVMKQIKMGKIKEDFCVLQSWEGKLKKDLKWLQAIHGALKRSA